MTEEGLRIYNSMTANEKERFRQVSRKLMSQCMLVRDKNISSRDDYIFLCTADHFQLLKESMDLHGYDVMIDRDAGVIRYCVSGDDIANRYNIPVRGKIILCALLLLYIQRLEGRHLMDKYIEVQLSDVIDVLEKYKLKDRFSGTAVKDFLPMFARFNIIEVKGNIRDMDYSAPIRIFPSIQFCLDESGIKEFIKGAEELLQSEAKRIRASALEDLKKEIREGENDGE